MAAQPSTQPLAQTSARPAAKPVPLRGFIGLPLPETWQQGLARVTLRLSGELRSRISWTRPGNWHLTLKFLGEVDEARLPDLSDLSDLSGLPGLSDLSDLPGLSDLSDLSDLIRALRAISFAPFALAVGRAGGFPQAGAPRVLWAGLTQGQAESARLAAQVEQALVPLGFAPEERPFAPHLTLGRVRQASQDDAWALVERAVALEPWSVAQVDRFVPWRSELGPGGPRYSRLAEFPARPE